MERTNEQYHLEIRQAAHQAIRQGVDSFEELCQACSGAWPEVIHDLVQDGPYAEEVEELLEIESPPKDVSVFKSGPDPSPTDYEWRFTRNTANELAELIMANGGRVLCIGAPTIYWALKKHRDEVVLVDRNPYLLELVKETKGHSVHMMDVHKKSIPYPENHFDVVILDAPWYLDQLHYWMSLANHHVKPRGLVLFPLLRQLTRPAAEKDREILLAYAATIGAVTNDLELVYETPKFEEETLSALGLGGLSEWRGADLVRVVIPARKKEMHAPKPDNGAWQHFRYGTQVVALRTWTQDQASVKIDSPYKDGSFVLQSVSARSKESAIINLRTSKNRVAVVEGAQQIGRYLIGMERGLPAEEVIRSITSNRNEIEQLQKLTQLLTT